VTGKSNTIKQAVILAGGEGRRLLPYTKVLPKPLWPVGDIPIVEVLIKQLSRAGIKDIIMAVGYQAELIKMILGDGNQYSVKIRYAEEKNPLGTAAPLKKIKRLDSNFLVLNGDLLTDLRFRDFARFHIRGGTLATVAVYDRAVKLDFGIVVTFEDKIEEYLEKPIQKHLVSMGVYAFNKAILKFIPDRRFDFPDLVDKLIEVGHNPSVYRFKGRWLDIGRPDDWERADKLFRRRPQVFLR
jgi:NDP-sugar pyrophosphorylase family protein